MQIRDFAESEIIKTTYFKPIQRVYPWKEVKSQRSPTLNPSNGGTHGGWGHPFEHFKNHAVILAFFFKEPHFHDISLYRKMNSLENSLYSTSEGKMANK